MIALQTALQAHLLGGTAMTSLLAGTAAVYYRQAPRSATLPYLIWYIESENDTNLSPRRETPYIAAIKAVAVDGYVAATIDDAVRARMATEFDVTGFDTVHQWRTNGYEYAEESDGKTYWHDGGRYSIELHKQ